jgi:hypothetical protein
MPGSAAAVSSGLLFGQQHSYTVTMRGNGEAVVLARIEFTNTTDSPQTTFSFEIPGKSAPYELTGFQQSYPQTCSRYGTPVGTPLKSPSAAPNTTTVAPAILPCLEYYAPDYSQPSTSAAYQKLSFKQSGQKFDVKLPAPVPSQQSGSLLLSYASKAYADSSFGAHSFNFETIKVNQRIARANVAVEVDSDQFLEGKSTVKYQPNVDSGAISAQAQSAVPSPAALNQIAGSIGQNGEIDKSTNDLAPGDTLIVKGRYASSVFLLRLPAFLVTIGLLALVVLLLLLFRKRIIQHFRTHHTAPKPAPTIAHLATAGPIAVRTPSSIVSAGNLLGGLISAFGISGVTWFVTWWSQNASSYSDSSPYSSTVDPFSSVLVAIIAILAYILFGLGPGVYLAATSRDWRRLVYVVTFEVLFLVAIAVIYVVIVAPIFVPSGGNGSSAINGGGVQPQ